MAGDQPRAAAAPALAPTTSTLLRPTSNSAQNPFTLDCTVSGVALPGVSGPTGTLSFIDTTTSQTLATEPVGPTTQVMAFENTYNDFPVPIGTPPAYNSAAPANGGLITEDLNGDHIPDLVWTSAGSIVVLLGNGDGTFTPQPTVNLLPLLSTMEGLPNDDLSADVSLAAADFNGDGKPDVVGTIHTYSSSGVVSFYFFVLLGNGDGTFQTPDPADFYRIGDFSSLAAGDFNGDGFTDVAVTNPGDGTIDVFLGNAAGTVPAPQSFAAGNLPGVIVAGNFTAGPLDLAVMNQDNNSGTGGGVSVLVGNGDGTFQAPITTAFPELPTYGNMVAADFNQDGKFDLAVGFTGNLQVYLLLGNGDGTFQIPSSPVIRKGPVGEGYLATADFNGDHVPDLVMVGRYGSEVMLGNGDGTFQTNTPSVGGPGGLTAVAADFNGDGRMDLATGGQDILNSANYVPSGQLNVVLQYTAAMYQFSGPVAVIPGTIATHNVDCTYGGDGNYASSVSNSITETFTQSSPPIFSLNVGNYSTAQTVTIYGAYSPIYYTTDNSTPSSSSTLYAGPITVSSTETLKAIAEPLAYTISPVSEVVYTITDPPAFSVPGGSYSTQQNVALSDGTAGAAIYYTTDGSTPGKTSTLYANTPIPIVGNVTLKAVALAAGNLFSPVITETYSTPGAPTTTAISASSLTAAENQKITLTATVTGTSPTGTVTFSAGSATLGTATLTSGVASLQVSFPNAGSYAVTAAYSGNATNAASTSAIVTVVVAAGGSATAITASTLTANENQMITLTATVTGDNPTGTVVFNTGSQSLGTGTLTAGVATLQTSFATAGSFPVSATYSGDANNLASTSSTVTVVVAVPSFAVTSSPASRTISAGQSATFTFTVTPAGGYAGTVNFACGTLPSEATCSFNQSSVVISGSGNGTSTLTINTQAPTTSRNEPPVIPFGPWSAGGTMALAGMVGLAFAPGKIRRWNRMFRALLGVVLLGALWLPLVGCGGGGGTVTRVGGTPSGSYTVSVTASDSVGGASTSANVTLIVQ